MSAAISSDYVRRFQERVAGHASHADSRGDLIENVVLVSAREARRHGSLEEVARQVSGKKLFTNDVDESGELGMHQWFAVVESAKRVGDEVRGNVRLRAKMPQFEALQEVYTRFPADVTHRVLDNGDVVVVPSQRTAGTTRESMRRRAQLLRESGSGIKDAEVDSNAVDASEVSPADVAAVADFWKAMDDIRNDSHLDLTTTIAKIRLCMDSWAADPVVDDPLVGESYHRAERLLLHEGIDATPALVRTVMRTARADRPALLESWRRNTQAESVRRFDEQREAKQYAERFTATAQGLGAHGSGDYAARFREAGAAARNTLKRMTRG